MALPRQQEFDQPFKVLLIGDSGKSSLLLRFTEGTFTDTFIATIGIDFKSKTMVVDDRTVRMQIWDTVCTLVPRFNRKAGQERFRTITTAYYRTAHGIILTYDVTNQQSFESLQHWAEQIDIHASTSVTRYIVGNKADLSKVVPTEKGQELANKMRLKFFETSAKDGDGVMELFQSLARDIQKKIEEGPKAQTQAAAVTLSTQKAPAESGSQCCGSN